VDFIAGGDIKRLPSVNELEGYFFRLAGCHSDGQTGSPIQAVFAAAHCVITKERKM
jgi:hypothetical protein